MKSIPPKYNGFGYKGSSSKKRLKKWRKKHCQKGRHLWFETLGTGGDSKTNNGWLHYLVCDACQIMVIIDRVDRKYAKQDRLEKQKK